MVNNQWQILIVVLLIVFDFAPCLVFGHSTVEGPLPLPYNRSPGIPGNNLICHPRTEVAMNHRLAAHSGPLRGQTFLLTADEVCVGREPSAQICIADLSVSRQHCRIRRDGEHYRVHDLDSLNGTLVNGVPVAERQLGHGDEIRIGDSCFFFLSDDGINVPAATVLWEEKDRLSGATVELRREEAPYAQRDKTPQGLVLSAAVVQNLNALLKISSVVHSVQDPIELAERLLQLLFEVVPAEYGVILQLRAEEEEPWSVLARRRLPTLASDSAVSRTVLRRVTERRMAMLNNDVLEGAEFKEASSLASSQVRSLLAVPLLLFETVTGVIYLVTRDEAALFTEDHLQLLSAVASIGAVALDNARLVEGLSQENRRLQAEINLPHNMVGESPRMRDVLRFIGKVAAVDSTILIRGESGTGKELVARAIHNNSLRRDKPFVAINCAALTESLLESELFGYEKGAFTNALSQKKGKLETADGGTVFLDEVGELAPTLQAKLLRVLQEREFDRVGGTRPVRVDIRLIAATNKNLEEAIQDGSFRQDLYFRLNVVAVSMPPLRERQQDIPLLATYFIGKHSRSSRRRVTGLSPEARSLLLQYDWPGNIRELENAIERAIVMGSSEQLLPEDLPEFVLEKASPEATVLTQYHQSVNETKREMILKAFENAGGSYTETAKLLGLHPNYLHRLIRNLKLKPELKKRTGA